VEPDGDIAGSFFREVLCLLLCAHPTVLPVIGWNLTPRDLATPFFHVTSYVEKCLVSSGLAFNLTGVDDTVKMKFAYGVACGMQQFHGMDIFHRDLKLGNIFYDANGPRIADLGCSSVIRRGQDETSQTDAAPEELLDTGESKLEEQSGDRGTVAYAAPEVLDKRPRYGLSADVYSYGICLWELMMDELWGSTLLERFSDAETAKQEIKRGFRPPLEDQRFNAASRELLHSCFGADIEPGQRPSFSAILRLLGDSPADYFGDARVPEFNEYKDILNHARIEPIDANLKYLLEQLTDIIHDTARKALFLPPGSPYLDEILFCLGRMFGDEHQQNDEVVLIARYQIATKGCLDGPEFVRELDALYTFPSGRSNFPLGAFLIDPDQPLGAHRRPTRIPVPNRNALFRALRNILVGICCDHPCVLKVHGWNIVQNDEGFSVLIVTDEADPFSIDQFKGWAPVDQSRFLLSAAIGVLELHCRGIFHNQMVADGWLQVKNGRAQICNFGLLDESENLDENPSLKKDTEACEALFELARAEFSRLKRIRECEGILQCMVLTFQSYVQDVLDHERQTSKGGQGPLQDLAQDIANDAKPKHFPFELFFHLVRCKELWQSQDVSLDVAGGLAELTRGLDDVGKARFKEAVNAEIDAHKFLPPGFRNSS
jgi:hypothetical protein